MWDVVIKQLIKEHGLNVDLKKTNILNTDFTYQKHPEKLPKEVINEIVQNTIKHIKEIKNEFN